MYRCCGVQMQVQHLTTIPPCHPVKIFQRFYTGTSDVTREQYCSPLTAAAATLLISLNDVITSHTSSTSSRTWQALICFRLCFLHLALLAVHFMRPHGCRHTQYTASNSQTLQHLEVDISCYLYTSISGCLAVLTPLTGHQYSSWPIQTVSTFTRHSQVRSDNGI